jgi:hypothetical protein
MVVGCVSTTVKEESPSSSVELHSVWQGTFDQVGFGDYPMILFISYRTGDVFEGTTWYPTFDNTLLGVRGQIKPHGVIAFTEEKAIRSPGGVSAGGQYAADLKGNTLEGRSFSDDVEVGRFVLKLAD